jgi:hypothetical protein
MLGVCPIGDARNVREPPLDHRRALAEGHRLCERSAVLLRRLGGLVLVVALGATAGTAALAGRSAAPANPTFVLVAFPKSECPAPKIVLGKACLDKSGTILPANWTLSDGNATWSPTGWTTKYTWSVPAAVAPSGGDIKLGLSAADKQGGSICPGIGANGGLPLKKPADTQLIVCAQANGSASGSRTLTVVPPSSGPVYVQIGLGDGPRFTYKYEAKAKPPGCGKLRVTASAGAEKADLVVSWRVSHHGVPETGESPDLMKAETTGRGALQFCDKPKGQAAVADQAIGTINHTDVHDLQGVTKNDIKSLPRADSITMVVKQGAYGQPGGAEKVTLVVEVTKSNDRDCPVGSRGKLSLTSGAEDRFGNELWLRLCGPSHTHRLKPGDDIDVFVAITET